MLGGVEAAVGALDQGGGAVSVAIGGDAEGGGDAPQLLIGGALEQFLGLDGPADVLGHDYRTFQIGDGQDGDEFLTAIARRQVSALYVGFERHGHEPQHLVAGLVAIGVVEILEMIDVDDHQAERLTAGMGLIDGCVQALVEALAVGNLGEGIKHGFAPHVVEITLQSGDILARGVQLLLQGLVGLLHAPGFGEQPLGQRLHRLGRDIALQVAAGRLQRARIGAGRGHRRVDRLMHRLDAGMHALGHARHAVAEIGF